MVQALSRPVPAKRPESKDRVLIHPRADSPVVLDPTFARLRNVPPRTGGEVGSDEYDAESMLAVFVGFHGKEAERYAKEIQEWQAAKAQQPLVPPDPPDALRLLAELNERIGWIKVGRGWFPTKSGPTPGRIEHVCEEGGRLVYYVSIPKHGRFSWAAGDVLPIDDIQAAPRSGSESPSAGESETEHLERIVREVRISRMTSTFDRAHGREMSRLKPGAPRLFALQKRRESLAKGEGRFPTTTGSTVLARIHDVEFDGTHLFWHITSKDGKLSKWWEGTLMLGHDEDLLARSPAYDAKKPMPELARGRTEHRDQSLRIFIASHATRVAGYEQTRRAEEAKRDKGKPHDSQALQLAEWELERIAKQRACIENGEGRFPFPDLTMEVRFVDLRSVNGNLLFRMQDPQGDIRRWDSGIPYIDPDAAPRTCCTLL